MALMEIATVCFVACHGGPAQHFAAFAKDLTRKGVRVEIYASGPALLKFQECESVFFFSLDGGAEEEVAREIAEKCTQADVVITDVGHSFDLVMQKALALYAPQVLNLAYYDNPEAYVPGGYSSTAVKVMAAAQKVLFANANLATEALYETGSKEMDLPLSKRVGIGYYPLDMAEKIGARRAVEQPCKRLEFFSRHGGEDKGQKILVYTGGNNEEYFSNAFPACLAFFSALCQRKDLSNTIFLLQQHPGALSEDRDGELVRQWKLHENHGVPKMLISEMSTEDALVLADAVLYHQTSMAPQFVLAGIPTVQIAQEPYFDILVKNRLCFIVNNEDELEHCLEQNEMQKSDAAIKEGIGFRSDWSKKLEEGIKNGKSF